MHSFVHHKNLENFRKLLAETTDQAKRKQLLVLLRDEEAMERLAPRGECEDDRNRPKGQ